MKALVVRDPWISLILAGSKNWEMRRRATAHRGPLALIRGGSGLVVGVAGIAGCLPALGADEFEASEARHGIPAGERGRAFALGWRVPWVLEDARALAAPVPYAHPRGAVTWVNLAPAEAEAVRRAAGTA